MSRRHLTALLCLASLAASTVTAKEPFRPNLGPELPAITVTCGQVRLLLRQASQWTPGRVDFRGAAMTTERSAYGTVFSFPEVGFIGSAHLENEPEELLSLAFFLDDAPLAQPAAELAGGSFRFERRSRIRGFELECRVELRGDRLYETTTVHAAEAVPLRLVYHFMHAWAPGVSAFLAGRDDAPQGGVVVSGALDDGPEGARKFHINQRVDWMAVFEPVSGQYAVSRLLEAPGEGGHISMLWNVPGSYRKYYLKCFENRTVPAGFQGAWRMVTAFGSATAETWQPAATKLARELRGGGE